MTLYRTLSTPDALRDWYSGRRNSSHHCPPGHWIEIRKNNALTPIEDYPLEVVDETGKKTAVYTVRARSEYLRISGIKSPHDEWTKEELERSGELAGICAFIKPTDAFEYSIGPGKAQACFVEFIGTYVSDAPEGVVATVDEIISVSNPLEFCAKHKIDYS